MWPFTRKSRTFVDAVILGTDAPTWTPAPLSANADEQAIAEAAFAASCLLANVQGAASLPARVQRWDEGQRQWVDDASSQLDEWTRRPCRGAGSRWTWRETVEWLAMQLYLHGRAYARVIRTDLKNRGGQGRLYALQPLEYQRVSARRGDDGEIVGYRVAGYSTELAPRDVLHLRASTPYSLSDGSLALWDIGYLSRYVDNAVAIRQAAQATNRANPGMIVSVDQIGTGVDPVTGKSQREALVEHLREQYQLATKDGRPMILGGRATVTAPPDHKPESYITVRRWTREEITALFRTPPRVLGLVEDATRFADSLRTWWWCAIEPLLGSIYDSINAQVVQPEMGPAWRVWYDTRSSQFALALVGDKIDLAARLVRELGYPANAAARYAGLGLEDFEELNQANVMFTVAGRTDTAANAPVVQPSPGGSLGDGE